jgi:hypothetical protein
VSGRTWWARVDAHPDTHALIAPALERGQLTLRLHCRAHRRFGGGKRHEEGIALGAECTATVVNPRPPQQAVMRPQSLHICRFQPAEECSDLSMSENSRDTVPDGNALIVDCTVFRGAVDQPPGGVG